MTRQNTQPAAQRDALRIAMVVPSLRGGGLERLARDLSIELRKRSYEVGVFCTQGLGVYANDITAAGVTVTDCSEGRLRVPGIALRLIRALARFKPDIMHAHSGSWMSTTQAQLVLEYPRMIFTEHGRYPPEPYIKSVAETLCYSRTDRLVAVSPAVAEYMQGYLSAPTAPMVISNGVDLSCYGRSDEKTKAELRSSWNVKADDLLVMSVGRFVEIKNHSGLLAALSVAAKQAPNLRLALVGTGPLEEALQQRAQKLGLGERAVFCGYRRDIATCLDAADCFVISSDTEGLPVSLLEAMASGLPTVSTDVGGISDALGHPPAGILVNRGNMDELASALVRIATDVDFRDHAAKLAKERVAPFSLTTLTDEYCAIYDTVMNRDRR